MKNEKDDFKRPIFWNKVFVQFDFVISLLSTILNTIKLPDTIKNTSNLKIILIIISIYIGSFLIILPFYSIIYSIRLYLYVKKIENRYANLYKYAQDLKRKYNQLVEKNKLIPLLIEDIIKKLDLALTTPTIGETDFIKKVVHLLNLDKFIYNER